MAFSSDLRLKKIIQSRPAGPPLVAGIKLPGGEISMPSQDRVWGEDGRDFAQSFAADGMSLHSKQATMVVVVRQVVPPEWVCSPRNS